MTPAHKLGESGSESRNRFQVLPQTNDIQAFRHVVESLDTRGNDLMNGLVPAHTIFDERDDPCYA